MHKIEEDVPMPTGSHHSRIYPFDEMEVGDSVFVDGPEDGRRAGAAAHVYARRNPPLRFTVRKVDGGVRIWRVA